MAVLGNLLPRLVFLLLLFVSSRAKVVTIDVQEAKNLIQAGYIYLDVRTVEEFVKGHVDAAKIINIPYLLGAPKSRVKNQDFLKDVSSACNKEDPLIVGFKNVKNMEGGYVEWVRNNFPVNTSVVVKEEL
ncbi:thiosulfate sulfurtransferase 18-like isoform X2 [Cicer arietinum]|uniref:Thiosulfate sulfurtransferase 18-like isoform X2 n=1 Tax=Cicer arietinum TaxID=3827 RepID=A0A1S2YZ03_CICAR|nr:thiosulfate sulfurtransferase 18-like isoform X2 [Cicer arietinum]